MYDRIKKIEQLKIGDILQDKKGNFCEILSILKDGSTERKNYHFKGFAVAHDCMFKFFKKSEAGIFIIYSKEKIVNENS